MPELVSPTAHLHTAWLEAHDDWGPGVHEDGFGLRPTDVVDTPSGFAAWVERLSQESEPGAAGCTYRWIVEDEEVLGGIALRHRLSDAWPPLGHIGYGIRPSARRRGLATWALGRILDEARGLGLRRVQVICLADNIASSRTIERCGGVLEISLGRLATRHYWINLDRTTGEP